MQADAYRRARQLMSSRREYVIARVLGFIQSLLIVALWVDRTVRGSAGIAGRNAVSGVTRRACCRRGCSIARPAKTSNIYCSMIRGFSR